MPDYVTNEAVSVFIAAAGTLIVRGLVHLLNEVSGANVLGSTRSPAVALHELQRQLPKVLIVDVELSGSLFKLIRPEHHRARVLLVGSRAHAGTLPDRVPACACGYLSGRSSGAEILQALDFVARCPIQQATESLCRNCPIRKSLHLPKLPLSAREYDVFLRLGWGHGSKRIAQDLGVSVKTIETYREHIKRKLRLPSAGDLWEGALCWRLGDRIDDLM